MTATPIVDDSTRAGQRPTATIAEATVVLGSSVGVFFAIWIARMVYEPAVRHGRIPPFTNSGVASLIVIEGTLTICLLPWLVRRGWRVREIAGAPSLKDILVGMGVWLGAMVFAYVFVFFAAAVIPGVRAALQANPFVGDLSIGVAAIVAIANAVFEEFLWLVYTIPTLTNRFDLRVAAVVSAGLRLSVHAYQGIYAVIGVFPVTIVFTLYYVKTRRVWPVIVAHVITDAIAFSRLVH